MSGTIDDILKIFSEIRNAFETRIELLGKELKKVEEWAAKNKFKNDSLVSYLKKILKISEFKLLDDRYLEKLISFFVNSTD